MEPKKKVREHTKRMKNKTGHVLLLIQNQKQQKIVNRWNTLDYFEKWVSLLEMLLVENKIRMWFNRWAVVLIQLQILGVCFWRSLHIN